MSKKPKPSGMEIGAKKIIALIAVVFFNRTAEVKMKAAKPINIPLAYSNCSVYSKKPKIHAKIITKA
jgi:hypothetical protein